jgi:hypothetical protein
MASFVLCAGSRPAEWGVRIVLTGSNSNVEWLVVDSKRRIYAPKAFRGCGAALGSVDRALIPLQAEVEGRPGRTYLSGPAIPVL